MVLTTGRGFAILSAQGEPVVGPYVEFFEVARYGPRQGETEGSLAATFEATFSADTLVVQFEGRTPLAFRVLDRYRASTAQYHDSWVLPFRTGRFALEGDIVFVRDSSRISILALRPRL